ncbi:MAG: ABC transporter permease [Clostridiales Family XIII bacterium]|jgi:peptide/nickel transport system permease protein|nr:ABC transporter permease [Clostridiales Family XIII bacterium]
MEAAENRRETGGGASLPTGPGDGKQKRLGDSPSMGGFLRRAKVFLRRMLRSKSAVIGGTLILIVVLAALLAPRLAPYNPYEMQMGNRLSPPSAEHLLGTDQYGRDLLSRIIYGSIVSLQVGVIAVGFAAALGVLLGLLAGYYGGWADRLIMGLVDVFLAFPVILLAIALVAALGPSPRNVMLALGLIYWTTYARTVRSSVLAIKEEEYILAARTTGAGDMRIIFLHILPNALAPIIVMATLGLGTAIISESTLSFLGLGVQAPEASWGNTMAFGLKFLRDAPHLSIFPGLAIMLTVLGFNLLGNGIRDVTDPKLNGRF